MSSNNPILPNPAQSSLPASSPHEPGRFSGISLPQPRSAHRHPLLISLTYVLGGLFWLWALNPRLTAWLDPNHVSSSLFAVWSSTLLIVASGGLLYGLLKSYHSMEHRARQAQDLRLTHLMEQMADAAFIKDRRGYYLYLNAAGARQMGRTVTECLNRDDSALFPAGVASTLIADDRRVIADGTLLVRESTFAIEGDTHVLSFTKWPYRDTDDNILGILGIVRDLTPKRSLEQRSPHDCANLETCVQQRTAQLVGINQALERQIAARIQMEIALRESEERFRQLAEHIREIFWVYGMAEERLIYISPAYEEVWGHSIEALHERPRDWIEAIHPDDRPRVEATVQLATQTTGRVDEEFRIVRPDGALRWIWARGFPVRDDAGYVYRIAGLSEDITARKLAEDQLRRQQVELTRMSRLSLAVELASNLAHELNQPLAAIVAYTQACLTLLRQTPTDPRLLTGTLEEIANQGLRAGEIIRHLRELVYRHPAAQGTVDLNALIHSVLHYAQVELRQARISVKLALADALPMVSADDIQIQLVVLYLIRNAIEAMNEPETGPRELTVSTAQLDPASALMTIRDTGPGFDPALEDQLFRPFFTTKPGGMGLGLSVSRSIIESQNGQLWATPNPDGGASFHFTLPIQAHP